MTKDEVFVYKAGLLEDAIAEFISASHGIELDTTDILDRIADAIYNASNEEIKVVITEE